MKRQYVVHRCLCAYSHRNRKYNMTTPDCISYTYPTDSTVSCAKTRRTDKRLKIKSRKTTHKCQSDSIACVKTARNSFRWQATKYRAQSKKRWKSFVIHNKLTSEKLYIRRENKTKKTKRKKRNRTEKSLNAVCNVLVLSGRNKATSILVKFSSVFFF